MPPFNDSDIALRGSAFLQSEASPQVVSEAKDNFHKDDDMHWLFGVPPKGNANFAWLEHFIHGHHSRILATLRDTLLRKRVSGEASTYPR